MAKKFKSFEDREKPKKRKGVHSKRVNKRKSKQKEKYDDGPEGRGRAGSTRNCSNFNEWCILGKRNSAFI